MYWRKVSNKFHTSLCTWTCEAVVRAFSIHWMMNKSLFMITDVVIFSADCKLRYSSIFRTWKALLYRSSLWICNEKVCDDKISLNFKVSFNPGSRQMLWDTKDSWRRLNFSFLSFFNIFPSLSVSLIIGSGRTKTVLETAPKSSLPYI